MWESFLHLILNITFKHYIITAEILSHHATQSNPKLFLLEPIIEAAKISNATPVKLEKNV